MKLIPTLLIILFLINCQSDVTQEKYKAIDIASVADSLTLLAENIISTALYERDIAISADQNQIIYTLGDYKQNKRSLVVVNRKNGKWTKPEILNISGLYNDIEPFLSVDGNQLYFASNRPIYDDDSRNDYNIWFSNRMDGVWAEPSPLDSIINTRNDEFYPSVSENGNLYFTATREDGVGREDIFKSELVDGIFQNPVVLSAQINTAMFEFNAYISPSEDVIVFSSFGRKDGMGGGDLYMSKINESGNWSQSENMGKLINSDKLDYSPFIDWKSGNLYFTSERQKFKNTKLQHVDELKELSNSTLNGFGNIYKIGLENIKQFQ